MRGLFFVVKPVPLFDCLAKPGFWLLRGTVGNCLCGREQEGSGDPLEKYCGDNPEADECRCASFTWLILDLLCRGAVHGLGSVLHAQLLARYALCFLRLASVLVSGMVPGMLCAGRFDAFLSCTY